MYFCMQLFSYLPIELKPVYTFSQHLLTLMSVFSEISVRTWVQVVSPPKKPDLWLADDLYGLPIRGHLNSCPYWDLRKNWLKLVLYFAFILTCGTRRVDIKQFIIEICTFLQWLRNRFNRGIDKFMIQMDGSIRIIFWIVD